MSRWLSLLRTRRKCRRAGPDMDVNEEYAEIHFFRTFREVWGDELTWEEIRANKFRPWGPRESTSQVLSQSTPVPVSRLLFPLRTSPSLPLWLCHLPLEVSQPLFSQSPSESVSPPEQSPPVQSPSESPPEPTVPLEASPPVKCSKVAQGYTDFGSLSCDICREKVTFELNRFVEYHHRGCQHPAKTPSPFDALRGETVVIQGRHSILPATFVPPQCLCVTFRGSGWVGASLICHHLSLSMFYCFFVCVANACLPAL